MTCFSGEAPEKQVFLKETETQFKALIYNQVSYVLLFLYLYNLYNS